MILIFSEDGGLSIADPLSEVQRHCEGIDVLSGVFTFGPAQTAAAAAAGSIPRCRGWNADVRPAKSDRRRLSRRELCGHRGVPNPRHMKTPDARVSIKALR